jgi:serine/threonine-protein kinase
MAENLCPNCKSPNRSNAKYCAGCGAPLSGKPSKASDTGAVLQGRYRIINELGRGGFGAVYKAWDANLNKLCAIKENLEASPQAYRQFVREATVLSNLSHSNLPRVTDHFFISGKGQYLVMDFVEGEDLASLINRQGAIPIEQALVWISQVADALIYLHGRQPPVIHRDIKPSNIRITPEGNAMLVDFGLVKLFDPNMKTTLGARAVTPGYAPPEQYGHGKTDARSDIYALGATLYNLLTARDPLESVQRMAGGQMQSVNTLNPRVSNKVSEIVGHAMALEPSQRYSSAAEFKGDLQSASVASDIPGSPADKVYHQRIEPAVLVKPVLEPAIHTAAQPSGTPVVSTVRDIVTPVPERGGIFKRRYLWIGIVLILVLCFGAIGTPVGWAIYQRQVDDKATADAREQATMLEGENLTSTANVRATMTSRMRATSTARALEVARATSTAQAKKIATAQALEAHVANIITKRTLVYGPTSGYLVHNEDDEKIAYEAASGNQKNFIVEVRFANPFPISEGSWDVGIVFRSTKDGQFRLVIKSDGSWKLYSIEEDVNVPAIAKGKFTALDIKEGGSNWIRLICQDSWGVFYINGTVVDELDLSSWNSSGGIWVATGLIKGDEKNGKSTVFQDFTVWSIP